MGLVGDGHGDWYDKQGNLKAKTISGELKMFTGRERQDDVAVDKPAAQGTIAPRSSFAKDIVSNLGLTPPATAQNGSGSGAGTGAQASSAISQAKASGPLTIAFDKFDKDEVTDNIIAAVEELAQGGTYYIFPSRDQDIDELKVMYPDISESIIDDKNAETIFDVLQSLYENGFDAINIVVRRSRAKAITDLAYEQNGELYNYTMLNVIPVDEKSIREQYLAGEVFNIGSEIEYGDRSGKVIRRGANHLICLDETKEMFRCWISEAREVSFKLPVEF